MNQNYSHPMIRNNIYIIRKKDVSDSHLEYFCSVSSLAAREELRELVYDYIQDKELDMLCYDSAIIEPNFPVNESLELFSELAEVLLPQQWEEDSSVVGGSEDFLNNTIMMVLHLDYNVGEVGKTYYNKVHRLYERQYNI